MNREIDRKIAELMGYTIVPDLPIHVCFLNGHMRNVPQFSTDWNDMRLLVEWLQGKRIDGKKIIVTMRVYPDGDCQVTLTGHGSLFEEDTAPLALCQAVLSLPPEVLK